MYYFNALEVASGELDAAERLLWRRWMDAENLKNQRKSRVQAPCCGRYRYRYQLEQDVEGGGWYCDNCWAAAAPLVQPPAAVQPAGVQDTAAGDAAAGTEPQGDGAEQPAKRRKQTTIGKIDYWNHWRFSQE